MKLSPRDKAICVILAPCVVLAAIVVPGKLYLDGWRTKALKRFDEIESRYARIDGVIQAGGNLQAAAISANTELTGQTYPAATDSVKAANDVLQRLRTLAEAQSMTVATSQVLPSPEAQEYERVLAEVSGTMPMAAVPRLLKAIRLEQPAMAVEELQITPMRRSTDYEPENVTCRVVVFSLRGTK